MYATFSFLMFFSVAFLNISCVSSIIINYKIVFSVKKITVQEENATRDPRKCSIEEKLLSGKVHFKFCRNWVMLLSAVLLSYYFNHWLKITWHSFWVKHSYLLVFAGHMFWNQGETSRNYIFLHLLECISGGFYFSFVDVWIWIFFSNDCRHFCCCVQVVCGCGIWDGWGCWEGGKF